MMRAALSGMKAGDENALREATDAVYADLFDAQSKADALAGWATDSLTLAALPGYFYVDDPGGIRTELKASGEWVSKLSPDGKITSRLFLGEISWSQWLAQAGEARSRIVAALEDMNSTGAYWGRFWNEVVVDSAIDAKDFGKGVGSEVSTLLPWVVAGIIALVFAYALFSFRGLRSG